MPGVQRQLVTNSCRTLSTGGVVCGGQRKLSEVCAGTSICHVEHSSDKRAQVCKIPNIDTVALCLHVTSQIKGPDIQALFNYFFVHS